MSAISIATFTSTVHKSNEWVHELMDELHWDEPQRTFHGLRSALHALRGRLTVNKASDLAAQLPI
jgi:uncharacterized protein (DUF2267 family)